MKYIFLLFIYVNPENAITIKKEGALNNHEKYPDLWSIAKSIAAICKEQKKNNPTIFFLVNIIRIPKIGFLIYYTIINKFKHINKKRVL